MKMRTEKKIKLIMGMENGNACMHEDLHLLRCRSSTEHMRLLQVRMNRYANAGFNMSTMRADV